jgi:hypothetical protein
MRFAKAQEKKMGKPESTTPVVKRGPMKSPISKPWISTHTPTSAIEKRRSNMHVVVLGFVLCGGLLFEVLKMFF